MTDLPEISDEAVDAFARAFNACSHEGQHPLCCTRAGLAAALVASGWRREADVLREVAEAYAKHWRSAAGVGWAVDLPSSQAGFVAWLENRAAEIDRATALEPLLPLPVADGREVEQGQERSEEKSHG